LTGLKNKKNCPNYHQRQSKRHRQQYQAGVEERDDGDDESV
jgi:hypothetical protein